VRVRHLAAEQSVAFKQGKAANLARESEDSLVRQMGEMQALAEEQRRAGLLLVFVPYFTCAIQLICDFEILGFI
jgi:hypothetical protein